MTAAISILLRGQATKRLAAVRARITVAARATYPHTQSPVGRVMLDRMGINSNTVVHGSITKRGYLMFSYTPSGKRVLRDGQTVKIKQHWTREQKRIVRVYWPALERAARGKR